MTKEKFVRFHEKRGYKVEDLGKIVVLSYNDFMAIHFFNSDGSRDKSTPPVWKTSRH